MPTHSQVRAMRRTAIVGLTIALGVVVAATGLLVRSQQAVPRASAWVDHTHRVIEMLDGLEVALGEAQSAERGYLLTGDREALAAYGVAEAHVYAELNAAADSTHDNVLQRQRLSAVRSTLRSAFHEMARAIVLYDVGSPHARDDGAAPIVAQVRDRVERARAEERRLLVERSAHAKEAMRDARLWAGGGLLFGIAAVVISFWAVRRETRSLLAAWRAAREAEGHAVESEARYRMLFASNPRPSWVYDRETLRFLAVNAAAVAHYGYSEPELLGMTLADVRPDEDRAGIRARVEVAGDRQVGLTSSRHRARDGRVFDVELASHPIDYAGRPARLVLVEDVTDRKRLEAALTELSLRDELTGLLNRRGFTQMAEHELKAARRVLRSDAVLFLDLDGFKQINDTHGHAEGDVALRIVADLLRTTVREGDLVARLGGDELVIYASNLTRTGEGKSLAVRLGAALDAHNAQATFSGRPYRIGFSIGIAELEPGDSLDELLARADASLYEAKQRRRATAA